MAIRHPAVLASLLVLSAALLWAGPARPQAQLAVEACDEPYTVFRQREGGWERRIALRLTNNADALAAGQARVNLLEERRFVDCPLEAIPPGESHDVIWVPRTRKVMLSITAHGGAVLNQTLDLPDASDDTSVLFPRSPVPRALPPLCVRGTNYLPRDHPWPGLWRDATPEDLEADFALMARLGINTIRTFTWYDPDQPNAKLGLYYDGGCATATALKRLSDLLTIADRNHVKVILMTGGDTLIADLAGARRTFKSVFGPLVEDGRILMIDVLNEPGGELGPKASPEISTFLTTMYPYTRELMPNHPLTVGLAWQFDQLFDLGIYPDIAQYHEYSAAVGLPVPGHPEVRNIADGLRGVKGIVGNRPILIGEFGHSTAGEANGGVTEERQREIYQGVLEGAEDGQILGVANWCLFDFVPDWMGKKEQHFGIVRADGSLKPAGELLQQTYLRWREQYPAPWDARAQEAAGEPPGCHYLFFEAEKVFTSREQWLAQNWNNPSGGEWIYGNVDRGNPTGEIELPDEGPWFVWVRLWDWDAVDRRAVLEVNGEESYICGGSSSSQWVWYHTHVADGPVLDLRLSGVDPMDAWVDCLAVTDDPSWVPPHEMVGGGAYTSDGPYERLCRKAALIWPRGAGGDVPLSFYRRSFLLAPGAAVLEARIRVAATGYWVVTLNGEEVGHQEGGQGPATLDLGPNLREGANALCIELEGDEPQPGVWIDGEITTRDGWVLSLRSSPAWHSSLDAPDDWQDPEFDDRKWGGCWARVGQKPL